MSPEALAAAAGEVGVTLTPAQCDLLDRYVELLTKWNASFNLVSRKDVDRLWTRHVLDSLSVLPLFRELHPAASRALDVGTGAGFPGLPLAIADPAMDWLLVDRNARKVRFLELVAAELDLENVMPRCLDLTRVSRADPEFCADLIVSRAVADPAGLVRLTGHLLRPAGAMILLTGTLVQAGKDPESGCGEVRRFVIPGLDRAHEVTIIREPELRGSGV